MKKINEVYTIGRLRDRNTTYYLCDDVQEYYDIIAKHRTSDGATIGGSTISRHTDYICRYDATIECEPLSMSVLNNTISIGVALRAIGITECISDKRTCIDIINHYVNPCAISRYETYKMLGGEA